MPLMLDFDPTAELPANYIQNESHVISGSTTRYWVPSAGCFFTKGLELRRASDNYLLKPGIDYKALHFVSSAAMTTGKEVCAIIWVYNTDMTGEIKQSYHAVGGEYSATVEALEELLANLALLNANEVAWGQLVGVPEQFPPTPHGHHLKDWYGMGGLITKLEEMRQAVLQGDISTVQMIYQYIDNALANLASGLGGLSEEAIGLMIASAINSHKSESAPHSKAQVGLPDVPAWSALSDTDATVAGVGGKVTQFMNAAQILSLIQDRVTRTWLSVDQLPNYGEASNTDINNGTATNKLMTVAGTIKAILNNSEVGTNAASAATIMAPFFTANFTDANPPTDVSTGGVVGQGIQFFKVAKGTTISTTTPRVQLVLITSGTNAKGLWTRTHDGISFSDWAPAGSVNSSGLTGITQLPQATDGQAWDGGNNASLTSPSQARKAAGGLIRHVGAQGNTDLDTTLQPVLVCASDKGPTGVTTHMWKVTTTWECTSNSTDANTTAMSRTQVAEGITVMGTWIRRYLSTTAAWSNWRPNGASLADHLYSNINRGLAARTMRGAADNTAYLTTCVAVNDGVGIAFSESPDTTADPMTIVDSDGNIYGGVRVGEWTVKLSGWGVKPTGTAGGYSNTMRSCCVQRANPVDSIAGGAAGWMGSALQTFQVYSDPYGTNYVAGNTTNYRSALMGSSSVYSISGYGGDNYASSVTTGRLLRVAGSYALTMILGGRTLRTNPGFIELASDLANSVIQRIVQRPTILLLEKQTSGSKDIRFMVSMNESTPSNQMRFGTGPIHQGAVGVTQTQPSGATGFAGQDGTVGDAELLSTSTRISRTVPGSLGVLVGMDSTGGQPVGLHVVVSSSEYDAANPPGQFAITWLRPVYNLDTRGLSSINYTTGTWSLNPGERAVSMCSWDGYGKFGGETEAVVYCYTMIATNLGRIIVKAIINTFANINVYDVLDYTITDVNVVGNSGPVSLGYVGGIIWMRGRTTGKTTYYSPYEVAIPWSPSIGAPLPAVTVTKEIYDGFLSSYYHDAGTGGSFHRSSLVQPLGRNTFFFNRVGIQLGNINYQNDELYR